MIDKQARSYLAEMGIDVWQTRPTVASKTITPLPAWPLVIVVEPLVLQQHQDLFKGIVAAMKLEWEAICCVSQQHFPEGYQGWVLWADANTPPTAHPHVLQCDPELLASDRQAKRVLWQQICTQILAPK
ncbi:DNA polymerase III subunit psi [Agarivorans sp. MS3-6]